MTQYKYVLIDEFGGVLRKFVSKAEATPYLTEGSRLVYVRPHPRLNPYTFAFEILGDALC